MIIDNLYMYVYCLFSVYCRIGHFTTVTLLSIVCFQIVNFSGGPYKLNLFFFDHKAPGHKFSWAHF